MSNPWFRMYTDFLNDPKMISLAFEDQRHFIGILALKSDGTLDQVCEEKLLDRIISQRLWIDYAIISDVKKRLFNAGLINAEWQPLAWDKRQFKSDKDNTAAERQRRFRESQTRNALRNGTVTRLDTDTDTDTEQKQSKPKPSHLSDEPGKFVLPEWINQESWDGFVAMRKAIKKPLTLHAKGLLILSLQKMASEGEDINAVLNQSSMNSWQGLFPIKNNQRMSYTDRKAKEKADNEAALDAWARGEPTVSKPTFIEGEFHHA